MDTQLFADGPYRPLASKLMLYGQFVGVWDVEWAQGERGEWHFGWILGGRGVQDVLFPVGEAEDQRGTTVRCYDEKLDAWRVSWMGPAFGEFANLVGRADGDGILQEGSDERGLFRWTFSDIKPDYFHWEAHNSADGGQTWTLVQEMHARRRS